MSASDKRVQPGDPTGEPASLSTSTGDDVQNAGSIAQEEYATLLQEAQDACARRVSSATTIGAADAGLLALQHRVKRLDAMTEQQLVDSAMRRARSPLERL